MRIAHLSDPHFGAINDHVPQILLRHLTDHPVDLIILTGDITQRARTSQFREAARFVQALAPVRVLITPGNHDVPLWNVFQRVFRPFDGFQKHLQTQLATSEIFGQVGVTILNSCVRYRHIQGEINLNELEHGLESISPAPFKIVGFHHPMACRDAKDQKNLLINRKSVSELCLRHGVDLVVGGHIHDPFVTILQDRFIVAVAGSCASYRIRYNAPNSFNCYEISDQSRKLKVERFDLLKGIEFQAVSVTVFSKSSLAWEKVQTSE